MKTLYVKFVVGTIAIMILSSILAFIISNSYYQQKLKPENDEKITMIAQSVTSYIEDNPQINLQEYLETIASTGHQLYLVDNQGKEQFFGAEFRDKSLSDDKKKLVLNGETYHGILHFPQETFVTGFFANELQNTIGIPVTHNSESYALFMRPDIKLLFNEVHFLFGAILILTIILSIVFVVFSTKYQVKPISQLTAATKSLADGDYQVELDTNRQDELGELSQSFLRMAKKIEQLDDVRKEFISNISHDIQSPLSNIKGYTNLLKIETNNEKARAEYAAVINDEINRLSNLTEQLLVLASLDRSDNLMKKKRFNIGEQIKELVRNYQWQINEKNIMLSYTFPDIEIIGDPTLLHMIWDNLLSNALKYNQPYGSIKLAIEENEESVVVTFENTGITLSNSEIERIFDRFYRADSARTRTIEGTGLGLSIVWTIIQLHGGQIRVDNTKKKHTIFSVWLPKNQ